MAIPKHISAAVDSLLAPFGTSMAEIESGGKSKPDTGKVYLGIKDAETLVGVGRRTLSRWCEAGYIGKYKLSESRSGKVLLKLDEIENFLATRRKNT